MAMALGNQNSANFFQLTSALLINSHLKMHLSVFPGLLYIFNYCIPRISKIRLRLLSFKSPGVVVFTVYEVE